MSPLHCRHYAAFRAVCFISLLSSAALPRVFAQAAPAPASAPAATTSTSDDEALVLSPFVVDVSEDKGSYKATSTLAGTRIRTDLRDVASAISVVTGQFLQDTAATNSQDLLIYTPNTEVAGTRGNFTGQSGQSQYQEAVTNPSNVTRVRGLDTADNTRDYFLTDIPWDAFNTGRIDLQRGPNSILFGVGSPAGIINNSLNNASFKNAYRFENRVGSYGTIRDSADANFVIIPKQLAIRTAWVTDDEKYKQQPAFNNTTRFYGALRWEPKLLGERNHTSFRANYERGAVHSNNPRALPPTDEITQWFDSGTSYGNPGLNKLLLDQWKPGYQNGSAPSNPFLGFVQGRSYWDDPLTIFNGAKSVGGAIPPSSSTPTFAITPLISTGYDIGPNGQITGSQLAGNPYFKPYGIPTFTAFGAGAGTYGGTVAIPSGGFFIDKVIQDPTVFDFYNHLLDGKNKKEWQNWKAGNINFSQTFLDDRFGIELVYDNQHYVSGQYSLLSQEQYSIGIDPNVSLTDGTPNPNVGRPYVANSTWAPSTSATTVDRKSLRATATADIRSEDFLGRNKLSKALGHIIVTGVLDEDHKDSSSLGWAEYAADANWPALIGPNVTLDSITTYRQFDFINYIGPSLLSRSSAHGANIGPVTNIIMPTSQEPVKFFNSHWNRPTNPNDPNYVNPAAPFTHVNYNDATTVVGTQSDNPANYVGWQTVPVHFLNASNPQEFPDTVISAMKTKYTDISSGITFQGYFLGGDLVPVFGYRKDSVVNYRTAGPQNDVSGVINTDYSIDPKSRTEAAGASKSWGGVYHFPKSLMSRLPGAPSLSVYYDRSSNFKADAPRQNILGGNIDNPRGNTKEYGFTVGALNDKLTLKVGWYKTILSNATLDSSNGNSIGGLGGNGYMTWSMPTWGMTEAAQMQDALQGRTVTGSGWNYLQMDGTPNNGPGDPVFDNSPQTAKEKAIVAAWLQFPLDASFFKFYSIHPMPIDPAAGRATGNIRDMFGSSWVTAGGDSISPGSEQWLGSINAVTTTDVLSRGEEFELDAQPTSNWNITVNYTRTFATHTNIDPTTSAFMANQYKFFSSVAGDLRLWGGGGGTAANNYTNGTAIGPQWIRGVYNPYLVEVATQGHSAPEVAPWRLNLISTYNFDRGSLKGFMIGGAGRVEAGRILGYAFDPTTNFLDVNHPWIGKNDTHVDGWIGYTRRITARKVNWRIQLNVRNIGEKYHLVTAAVEPDGSVGLARIQEGMTWALTNTFEF